MANPNVQTVNEEDSKKMGMEMVMGLLVELSNVKRASGLDLNSLKQYCQKLVNGLQGIRAQVCEKKYGTPEAGVRGLERSIDIFEDRFQPAMG